jgi:UrcA family protein
MLAGAAIAAFGVPASGEALSRAVSAGDLSLASAEGARALIVRLKKASSEICPQPQDVYGILGTQLGPRVCVEQTVPGAVEHLDLPSLTAAYSARRPTRVASRDGG